jgi:hypothetical protein
MSEYVEGHVKRDPVSGAVAVRTQFPEDIEQLRGMAWLVATTNIGARNAPTAEVEDWEDIHIPETNSK